MTVRIPFDSVEKPLTPIDYICAMRQCDTVAELHKFVGLAPGRVTADERFGRALLQREAELLEREAK